MSNISSNHSSIAPFDRQQLVKIAPSVLRKKVASSRLYKEYKKSKSRKSLLRPFPSCMNIELTNRCNLNCSFCPRSVINIKPMEIEWETVVKFTSDIKELKKVMIEEVCPVGLGEPFLYSRWEEAFSLFKSDLPGVPLRLVTNGVSMDLETSRRLTKVLQDEDSILISLNAWDKTVYQDMMGADRFMSVRNNIEQLIKERDDSNKKFAIKVQLIQTSRTVDSSQDFKRYWSERLKGPNDRPDYFRQLENWGGKIDTQRATLKTSKSRYPCLSLWSLVVVDVNGNAFPCCEALSDRKKSHLKLGNILEDSIADLYRGDKLMKIRKKHLAGEWDTFPECVNCDFWSSTPNIWKVDKAGIFH